MPLLIALAAVASYAIVAGAIAVVVPPWISGVPGWVCGVLAFLGCALIHLALSRRAELGDFRAQVADLRRLNREALKEASGLRERVEALESLSVQDSAPGQAKLVAEMQVLQGLLAKLAAGRGQALDGDNLTLMPVRADRPAPPPPRPMPEAMEPEPEVAPRPLLRAVRDDPVRAVRADAAAGLPPGDALLIETVREALEANRVDLYVQPIVSLPQRKVRYYECFSRIRDASGAVIGPQRYLQVALNAGMLPALDNLLLFRCLQVMRRLRRRSRTTGFVVNLSPTTLQDQEFFPQFIEFMRQQRELADGLVFELPQAAVMNQSAEVEANLMLLTELGFTLSLDHVTRLDFDGPLLAATGVRFVKIGADVLLQPRSRSPHPNAVKELLARHGIDLVVEKIEEERTVIDLLDYNVDFGQGHLFGEPKIAREQVD
ncbi:EAL domain-containing protein [Zavarzinia sp. CC-PAN008]|uniref:EAL domain-containing protein n=1 Tax=Zavarzinia sp. CC-PAN008 TaxID=3243332 RepID=UPI003F747D3B